MKNTKPIEDLFGYIDGKLIEKTKRHGRSKIGEPIVNKPCGSGYSRISFNGKYWQYHKAIFYFHNGWVPDLLDHIDHDSSNNRIENLRPASYSQNNINRVLKNKPKSGFRGVYKTSRHRWVVYLSINSKRTIVGRFCDPVEAAKAHDRAAKEIQGEFAILNFPD